MAQTKVGIRNMDPSSPLPPTWIHFDTLVIRASFVPGNVATLGKCHGSHGKDRKDKYNDKYMGKYKDKNDRE